jgi:hypothetical protein
MKVARLGFDRNYRVLPQPIRPAFLDKLAGVERDRPKELRGIRGALTARTNALRSQPGRPIAKLMTL